MSLEYLKNYFNIIIRSLVFFQDSINGIHKPKRTLTDFNREFFTTNYHPIPAAILLEHIGFASVGEYVRQSTYYSIKRVDSSKEFYKINAYWGLKNNIPGLPQP